MAQPRQAQQPPQPKTSAKRASSGISIGKNLKHRRFRTLGATILKMHKRGTTCATARYIAFVALARVQHVFCTGEHHEPLRALSLSFCLSACRSRCPSCLSVFLEPRARTRTRTVSSVFVCGPGARDSSPG